MYYLIVSALDYIRDEQGDYETALEKINVEDVSIFNAFLIASLCIFIIVTSL